MLYYLNNLSAESVYRGNPWEGAVASIPPEARADKRSFSQWCEEITTKHMFFSTVEGESGALRVSKKGNPVYQIHGIVADYDADITMEMIDRAVKHSPTEFLPNYASSTFSGHARLVWLFEKPILAANYAAAIAFQKEVGKALRLKKLLPGLDEGALSRPDQYYERGTNWAEITDVRIRPEFTWKWMSDACHKLTWSSNETKIPLEVIQEQIEKEYPGKWRGDFAVGVRSKRFWDSQADNETAAVVRESGFQCFTGPDPFVPWGQLLGDAFIKRYDADRIGRALNNIYYDDCTGKYWFQDARERWVPSLTSDVTRLLKVDFGLDPRPPKGGTYSEIDKTILEIQKHRRVDAALPFLYHRPGVLSINRQKFLNVSWAKCRQPAEKGGAWGDDFPWLARYLEEYFQDAEPLERFLAWWKRAYESGLELRPEQGHALFFAGPTNCGKTLLNQKIVGESLGGAMDARPLLVDGSDFSGSNLEYPVMSLDDSSAASDFRKHQKYSATLKAFVANPHAVYNQKFKAAGQVLWLGRILVSLNDDHKSLQMIPDLEQSLLDKIMLFKVNPPKTYTFAKKYELEATIKSELPFILRWLLDWEIPESCLDDSRFGVKKYHHPELKRFAEEADHSSSFFDVLALFLDEYRAAHKDEEFWTGSAAELCSQMSNCERTAVLTRAFDSRKTGNHMRSLSTRNLGIVKDDRRGSRGNYWKVPLSCID